MNHLNVLTLGVLLTAFASCNSGNTYTVTNESRPFIPEANATVSAGSDTATLRPLMLEKLPAGAIKPEGWLLKQAQLQRDGLNGHLGEISAWLDRNNNAWLVDGGDHGWEEVPYWLRGYSHLAYLLDDPAMLEETRFWIDAVLNSQKEDGFFGPVNIRNDKREVWAQMIMLWILQYYFD